MAFNFPKISSKRAIITFHSHGDLDAAGAAIALCRFIGKRAVIAPPDRPSSSARRLFSSTGMQFCLFSELSPKPSSSDFIVVLDSLSPRTLFHLSGLRADVAIDHHSRQKDEIQCKKKIQDPSSSSVCEMLYFMLKPKDKVSCIALAAGIISDSAFFKNASHRTFEAMAGLVKCAGVPYSKILEMSIAPESFQERLEAVRSCSSVWAEKIGERIVAFALAKSHEAHFAEALISLGADAAFVGCEGLDSRISARMRPSLKGTVRLDAIMHEVGSAIGGSGGGHEMAAAASGEKGNVQKALSACKKLIEESIAAKESGKIKAIEWQ